MEVNYIAILVAAIVAMAVGAMWFGPLFGRMWMRMNNLNPDDIAKREEMQKGAGPLYALQFALLLLQLYILSHFILAWDGATGVETAAWIWLGFIMPTIAGSCMWNTKETKVKWTMFFMMAGYQLVIFILSGLILSFWLK